MLELSSSPWLQHLGALNQDMNSDPEATPCWLCEVGQGTSPLYLGLLSCAVGLVTGLVPQVVWEELSDS